MSASYFSEKSSKPTKAGLVKALGASYKHWELLRDTLEREHGKLVEEWKYYGQKIGWTLKLFHKKRNLFFLTPSDKYFRVAFVFGDKAVAAVEQSDLPSSMIQELKQARKYVEGRGLRIEVRKRVDVRHIIQLVAIKINN